MNNNDNLIISVGRQLGSGGRTIAKMLADEFGCKFYDREVLNLAAKESGFSEEFLRRTTSARDFSTRYSTCTCRSSATRRSTTTDSRRRICSVCRATPYARLPLSRRAYLWAVVPTMCCASIGTWLRFCHSRHRRAHQERMSSSQLLARRGAQVDREP